MESADVERLRKTAKGWREQAMINEASGMDCEYELRRALNIEREVRRLERESSTPLVPPEGR